MITRSSRNPLFDLLVYEINDLAVNQKKIDDSISPRHCIVENEKEFIIELILAGVNKEDINVNIDDNILTINAERKKNDEMNYIRNEFYFGKYLKKYTLPDDIDYENIDVQYSDGILKMTIPKTNIKPVIKKSFEIN